MPRGKKELAEQIIPELREVEVEVGRGKTVLEAVKKIGVTEQTYSLGRRSSVVCGSDAAELWLQRFRAKTSTPAPTMSMPSHSRTDGRS